MALTKLGLYVEQLNVRNEDGVFGEADVRGLSTQKQYTETKANLDGVNLRSYKLFAPGNFAYVPDTSRRGDKVSLAFNDSESTFLVSSISIVFRVSDLTSLCPEYLFMYFNRPEFDRYARYNSWGSARETFNWEDMCDIEIDLPDIGIQRKYAAIYSAMLENQRCYEQGLDDLKLACDAQLDEVKRKAESWIPLGALLEEVDIRNSNGECDCAHGINIEKSFMPSNASSADLHNYKLVRKGQFVYSSMQTGRDECIRIALQREDETLAVSPAYSILQVNNNAVLAEYLMMWFSRSENDRLGWFLSDASIRANLDLDRFFEIEIPIPPIQTQTALAGLFTVLVERKKINDLLKLQLKDLCPILIKGSVKEASR